MDKNSDDHQGKPMTATEIQMRRDDARMAGEKQARMQKTSSNQQATSFMPMHHLAMLLRENLEARGVRSENIRISLPWPAYMDLIASLQPGAERNCINYHYDSNPKNYIVLEGVIFEPQSIRP